MIAQPLRNAVIVDLVRRKHVSRDACMALLRTHIQHNVWQVGNPVPLLPPPWADRRKIGDKAYRQKEGIPQGSKLSSLLCSFFYACLEKEHLAWVHQAGSVRTVPNHRLPTGADGRSASFVSSTTSYSSRTTTAWRDGSSTL